MYSRETTASPAHSRTRRKNRALGPLRLLLAICYGHLKDLEQANDSSIGRAAVLGQPGCRAIARAFYRETGKLPAAISALKRSLAQFSVKAELAYTYDLRGKTAEPRSRMPSRRCRPGNWAASAAAEGSSSGTPIAELFLKRARRSIQTSIACMPFKGNRRHGARADAAPKTRPPRASRRSGSEGPLYGIQLHADRRSRSESPDPEAAQRHLEAAVSGIGSLAFKGPEEGSCCACARS